VDVGMRLFNFVEKDDAAGPFLEPPDEQAVGCSESGAVGHSDELVHAVVPRIFGKVDVEKVFVASEVFLRQRPGKLRFAHAGRAGEKKRPQRPPRRCFAVAPRNEGRDHFPHCLFLADHAAVEGFLEAPEILRFALAQRAHHPSRLAGQDPVEVFRLHFIPAFPFDEARGAVEKVQAFVRLAAVRQMVLRRLPGPGRNLRADSDAVVFLQGLRMALQNGERRFSARFLEFNLLKAPGERRVAGDVAEVFARRGGADHGHARSGEDGLQQIRRVHGRSFRPARAPEEMGLVDEEDGGLTGFERPDHLRHPVFEHAPERGSRQEAPHADFVDLVLREPRRRLAPYQTARQKFDEGGLADAGRAGEHGVAFFLPQEHFDQAVHFLGPIGKVVEIALFGQRCQFAAVLEEYAVV